MIDISPVVQKLIVRSFPYQPFTVVYKKGSLIPIAYVLSRVNPMDPEDNIQSPTIALNIITYSVLICPDSEKSFSTTLDRIKKGTSRPGSSIASSITLLKDSHVTNAICWKIFNNFGHTGIYSPSNQASLITGTGS